MTVRIIKTTPFMRKTYSKTGSAHPLAPYETANRNMILIFEDEARLVFRLSGTGTEGATLRVYIERYEAGPSRLLENTQTYLQDLIQAADELVGIRNILGWDTPSVITYNSLCNPSPDELLGIKTV